MNLANRLGTKLYSHLKNGIKKSDFLVDLDSMIYLLFFFHNLIFLSTNATIHVPQFYI